MSDTGVYDLICVGGGAAGFFTAIRYSELCPAARILIVEKSTKVLSKVRISGGGRCNVTHACFDPKEMVPNYPRGEKELLGPFHHFLCGDMMAWLSEHGVETKIEADGRVFPVSDSSQTIIDLFERHCRNSGIEVKSGEGVTGLDMTDDRWAVCTVTSEYLAAKVMLATGSTPSVWKMMQGMGYDVVSPVPSLFTFNIQHPLLSDLQGLSMPDASVSVLAEDGEGRLMTESGPLLITHWGLSGPAILKLSSRGARWMAESAHRFHIEVNWIASDMENATTILMDKRETEGKQRVSSNPLFTIPKRLWIQFCLQSGIEDETNGELSRVKREGLAEVLTKSVFDVVGKSTYKDEFVTCGGIERKQVDFKTMESRRHPGLYMAGEVIDIDAVTGGFNFQAAWTEGWIAARAMAEKAR